MTGIILTNQNEDSTRPEQARLYPARQGLSAVFPWSNQENSIVDHDDGLKYSFCDGTQEIESTHDEDDASEQQVIQLC